MDDVAARHRVAGLFQRIKVLASLDSAVSATIAKIIGGARYAFEWGESMWWRRSKDAGTVYIPADLRKKFEELGQDVLSHALGSGVLSEPHRELGNLRDDQYCAQIWQWLREKRSRERRKVWIGWGIG